MRFKHPVTAIAAVIITAFVFIRRPEAQIQNALNEPWLKAFTYRNLGPFRMQVRVADVAVPDSPANDHGGHQQHRVEHARPR